MSFYHIFANCEVYFYGVVSADGKQFITSCKNHNKKVHLPREISSEESFEEIHGEIIEVGEDSSEEDYKYKVKKNGGKKVKSNCGCN